ncbi:MAG: DnaD domain protein, partial [Clostridia bacterium]|nr:DnaD domain protein [Clostridia bacterium]
MKYRKSRQKNMYLHDTPLENLFIGEYLAKAPGDYIKVYLMERMYAEMDQCQDVDLIGKQLNLETKDVEQANKYWSDKGLIIIKEGEIIFKELKSMMFGFEEADDMAQDNEDSPLVDKGLAKVFEAIESNWGQMLDGSKMQEVSSWVKDYNADYDLIIRAIVYCKERSKENINYLRSVVIGWLDAGCSSKEDVEKYLADRDQRYYQYRKIFNEIGLPGNPGEAHKAIMDRWFDDWHFNMDRIMEACKKATGIANPNLNYVNAILETWAKEAESQG